MPGGSGLGFVDVAVMTVDDLCLMWMFGVCAGCTTITMFGDDCGCGLWANGGE